MNTLTVLYDDRCGLCGAVVDWIARQPQIVPLVCAPKADGQDELEVAADTGERWSGDDAWLMVLWALVHYRPWAYRLASPGLRPTARALFATLSAYRGSVSCALGLQAARG